MDLPFNMLVDTSWSIFRNYLVVGLLVGLVVNRIFWVIGSNTDNIFGDIADGVVWASGVGFVLYLASYRLGYPYSSLDMVFGIPTIGIITIILGAMMMGWSKYQLWVKV